MKPERFATHLDKFEEDVHKMGNLTNIAGSLARNLFEARDQYMQEWSKICKEKNPDDRTDSVILAVTFYLREIMTDALNCMKQYGSSQGLRRKTDLPTQQELWTMTEAPQKNTYQNWLLSCAQITSRLPYEYRIHEISEYETMFLHVTKQESKDEWRGFRQVAHISKLILSISSSANNCLNYNPHEDNFLKHNHKLGELLKDAFDMQIDPSEDRIQHFICTYAHNRSTTLREALMRQFLSFQEDQIPPYTVTSTGNEALSYF